MQMIKKVAFQMIAFCIMSFAAPSIWNGSADVSWYEPSAQAYNLINAEQLAGLAKLVNDGTCDFAGKTITLGADIFLNDTTGANFGSWYNVSHRSWTPIGTTNRPFRGEFDGIAGKKNRKIYGLYINSSSLDYVGLFGNAHNVKISNLDVLVGKVVAKDNVGSLIGYAMGGSVTNVHAEARVNGNNRVGGLVGYFTGNISKSSEQGSVAGQDSVGGLVGFTSGTVSGTVKDNSYFVGNVSGRNYVGGLTGFSYYYSTSNTETVVSIDCSYSIGNVKGENYVGGLVGMDSIYRDSRNTYRLERQIKRSYAEGNVDGTQYVGGVLGKSNYGYWSSYSSNIYATIDSVSHTNGIVNGSSYVGGLVGFTYGAVMGSYSKGGVTGTSDYVGGLVGSGGSIGASYHEDGNVSGKGYVGGLAGYVTGSITSSRSASDVTGTDDYVGGLAGYATGSVTDSHSEGDVTGTGNYVGGLIGLSYYYYSDSRALTIIVVDRSYSIGNVKGVKYVGGLIGLDSIYRFSNNTYKLDRLIQRSYAQGSVEGVQYIGGVLGKSNYGYISSSYSSNFYSTMYSVSHTNGIVSGTSYVGGLVGYTYGSVKGSHSEGDVTGTGDYVGGLIGLSYYYYSGSEVQTIVVVDRSYSIGNVKGAKYVGGLIGLDSTYRYSSNTNRLERQIKRSYAQGPVEGTQYIGGVLGKSNYGYRSSSYSSNFYSIIDSVSHINGNVNGTSFVGGLVGCTYGSVTGSHSKGDVIGSADYVGGLVGRGTSIGVSYHEDGKVSGKGYVGGLVGYATSSVTGSHSKGDVMGTGNYVGGLIGLSYYYYSGSEAQTIVVVDSSYSIGNVKGAKYVGGLIGLDSIYRYSQNVYRLDRLIQRSYAQGFVEGTQYIGGILGRSNYGYISSSYSSNFYSTIDSVSHTNGVVNGVSYIGGLAGCTYGAVTGSHSEGDVIGTASYVGGLIGYGTSIGTSYHEDGNVSGDGYVGGLAGYVTGSITGSHSEGNVIGTASYVGGVVGYGKSIGTSYHENGNVSGVGYIGGLAGYGSVDSCYHIAGDVVGAGSLVGGLTGSGAVLNSYSEGNVTGLNYVGGVAGSSSKIRNSYAKMSFVKGRNSIGGLSGYVTDSIDVAYSIADSVIGIFQVGGLVGYARSAVDSSYSTANVKGDDNVGGLIGSAYGDVSNSYAIGNVIGDVEHSSAGNDNLGGLVGYQYGGSVNRSFALGDIYGTTKLGGLVGRFEGTKITQSYANGNVTGDYYGDPADEVGNYYIGGLVGFAKGSIGESYASGVVKGIEDEPVYTGCIVGYVNGSLSVTKSYYDKTKCNLGIDGGENSASVAGSSGKTTTEMHIQSTFANWDFTDTWMMMEKTYPFLQFYVNSLLNAVVTTESLEEFEYDGLPKTPQVTMVTLFGGVLTENIDYAVKYEKNVNAGLAKISVCGLNLYGGCKNIEFEIAPKAVEPTISSIDDVVYTGFAMTPEISVYNGKNLLSSTDYAVEYKDNINSGTATVSVTMKGNYSGSAVKTFKINKADPVIIQNPSASGITIGESLALSNLTNGKANVSGVFSWKSPKTKPSLDNTGYTVVFTPSDETNYNTAEIVVPVKVWDVAYVAVHIGKETFDSISVIKGTNYTLPVIPDSVGYDFIGFYKGSSLIGFSGDEISVNENTVIDAKYSVKIFAVNFVNGTVELQSDNLPYGSLPKFTGNTPVKTSSAKYTYTFRGWSPKIEIVSKPVTYTAVFDSVVNKYVITFMDGETELQSGEVAYGVVPLAPVVTLPENTAQYTYSFGGWDKEIVAVTEDATYTAVVNRVLNKYSVEFRDYNGSILKAPVEYDYGTLAMYVLRPTNPIRGNTAQYTYSFKGWNPAISEVTENVKYVAEYDSTLRNYTITFINGSEVLQSNDIDYGVTPAYKGDIPTKAATAQYTYTFRDWTPAIASVTRATTYTAVFDSVVNKYVITFMDGETELQSSEVSYGVVPTAPMVTLPKNTAQYTYSFGGWDKKIVAVTEAATYTAVINRVLNKYKVEFRDYDGYILKASVEYDYGTLAKNIVKPTNPIRGNTAQYTYSFKGWTPVVSDVTENAKYVAEYDSTLRSYTIAFKYGSEVLQSNTIDYGVMPAYKGDIPTKAATAQYTYTFKGWTPSISSVTGTATYTAVFDSTLREYAVTFKNGSTTLQTSDIAYGETPSYTGDTPTKASTDKYSYTFKSWNSTVASVTGAATYTAVFDSTLREYAVTFKNGTTILQTSEVAYGVKPSYTGTTPTKVSTDKYAYAFKGWNPVIASVTGAATYTAVFDSTLREYVVAFKSGMMILQASEVTYETKPSYTGEAPTKASTDKYTYAFKGWSPTIASVTGVSIYTAVFDSTLREYAVTFKNGTTALQTSDVAYGSKPSYTGSTPTKASTEKYTYTFKGWSPSLASVTGVSTYTAVFDSTLRKYTITFKNGSTTLQTSDVAYGTKPSYTGGTPTKKATNKYTYKFKGWNPAIAAVTKAATYQAIFDSTKVTGIVEGRLVSLGVVVSAVSRTIQISAAPKNSTYAILDMQGRVLLRGRVESANFNIAVPNAGNYLLRVGNVTRKVQVK